jgi:16S rRNA (guanine527-N7)-methyltransferase
MSNDDIKSYLQSYFAGLGLLPSPQQYQQLQLLVDVMLADPLYPSVSKIFDRQEIALKHILDSLAPLSFNLPLWKSSRIIDLGTGGGFPCLPLAIFLPASAFLAVDARQKSVEFVARMSGKIGLNNVAVRHARIEDLGRDGELREKSDLVVCRALSAVRTLVEYTMPLVRNGGWTFYYKGPKLDEELAESVNAFEAFRIDPADAEILRLNAVQMPFERSYLAIRKNHPVPDKYPRKSGLPASKPL